MSRVQLALNVSDLDAAVGFYSKLFATEPAKLRPGYANFAIAEPPLKLVLIEGVARRRHAQPPRRRGGDHRRGRRRRRPGWAAEGLATATEDQVSCCYAVQDKVWVDGPDGRAVGDLHRPGRRRDARRPAAHGRPRRRGRRCAAPRRCARVGALAAAAGESGWRGEPLGRRACAELVGTALLLIAVVGSGIAAQRLSPGDTGLQLLENAAATAAALVAIILAVGPVSGAHFNPVVTLADRAFGGVEHPGGRRLRRRPRWSAAVAGAVVANLMFDLPAVELVHARSAARAACGSARSSPPSACCWSSSAWSARAGRRWRRSPSAPTSAAPTSSRRRRSFANPAVTLARTLSDTFAGIDPASVPAFVVAQLVGAALAVVVPRSCTRPRRRTPDVSRCLPIAQEPTSDDADDDGCPPCCSCASTTPAGRRWRSAGSTTWPAAGPSPGRAARSPATEVNPAAVAAMAEVGIDISEEFPKPLDRRDRPGRRRGGHAWAAATPARSSRASATRTGSSPTRPARASRRCGRSATRSERRVRDLLEGLGIASD